MERGLFYGLTGKGFYADIGARFLVIREGFEAICAYRYAVTDGASEEAMGAEQEAWFLNAMKGSDATWKIWGNEFCLNGLHVDLKGYGLPPAFDVSFSLIVEDWTGMPNRRDKLIGELSDVGNVVAITGDIHAFFAATPFVIGDASKRIVELVTSSISSSALRNEFVEKASSDPAMAAAGAPALAFGIIGLLQDKEKKPSPQLAYANVTDHGYAVMEVGAETIEATFHAIDGKTDIENLYEDPSLASRFIPTHFTVKSGANDLFHEVDGVLKRWDPVEADWV
jgi:alkaline phosphatase D